MKPRHVKHVVSIFWSYFVFRTKFSFFLKICRSLFWNSHLSTNENYPHSQEIRNMGFKSKATKANKAKKQERKPIQRKMEGQVWKIRTDLRPSNEVGKGGLCQYHFPGNERDSLASRTEIQEKELQFIKDKINGSWGFRR